jgi:glutamyl-tRNA synthetase/nondiscriminating glutamyl-tRNA synthetase
MGGVFLLRIEDTDLDRSEVRYETQLMEDLLWLGLVWDEGPGTGRPGSDLDKDLGRFGPYRQSERLAIYAEHTRRLLDEGKAYRCFCTPEELEAERKLAAAEHGPQVYSGRCRALSDDEVNRNLAAGKPFAVRLRIGKEPLRFHDLVRGPVEFAAETVSDPILVRSATTNSEGPPGAAVPVYNYVVTIDDALMEITHVIRGDDHISNTPKQVAIYEAFGWAVPEFAHLSTILGADRERLSKRHGATSIATFREMGYLPEALVNYLALLGWGAEDGKTETFTLEELTRALSLERVTPSPAIFDFDKLNWLNRHYLKQAAPERIAELAWGYFANRLPARDTAPAPVKDWFMRLLAVDSARTVLGELSGRVRAHSSPVTPEIFKEWLNQIKAATGVKGQELFHPVRIAITGAHSGREFDKLLPLIEDGAQLGLGFPSVRERVERFVGV